jgi:glycosyltransferase involved in cell wall biosynthesis
MRSLLWTIERLTAWFSSEVMAVSQSLKLAFLHQKLCPHEKITVLGFGSSKGVNLERFRPPLVSEKDALDRLRSEIGLLPAVPVIGFVGRLNHDKGLRVLDEARVALSLASVDHQLVLVGENEIGSELHWTDLPGLRKPIFVGSMIDVSEIYRVFDVLCLPTLREGLPNVCLEAAASSVPIVTTNATGAVDAIEPGVTGLLAEKGSSTSLAKALTSLLTDPDTRMLMGASSRIWVQERFNEDLVVDAYVSHFSGLLKDTSGPLSLGQLQS